MEQLSQHHNGDFLFKSSRQNIHTHTHTITKITVTGNGWSSSSLHCCSSCPVQSLELDWATRPHWPPLFKPHAAVATAERWSHDSLAVRDCLLLHLYCAVAEGFVPVFYLHVRTCTVFLFLLSSYKTFYSFESCRCGSRISFVSTFQSERSIAPRFFSLPLPSYIYVDQSAKCVCV